MPSLCPRAGNVHARIGRGTDRRPQLRGAGRASANPPASDRGGKWRIICRRGILYPDSGEPEKPLPNQFRRDRCTIRARFLDPASRSDLIDLGRDGCLAHRLARRANALVLLDDGMSCGEVAKVLLLDDDTVRISHRLYKDESIEGLASFG
jgi:hypothetical protein